MADTRTSNSLKNSAATIFGRIATLSMEFILRTVLIKTLGIEYGGVSSLFTDVLEVLSLMELGLGGAILYALYKPIADNDYRKINALMRFYKIAYSVIAFGVFLMGLCFVPFLDTIVKNVPNVREDIRIIFMLYVTASSCSYLVIYKETLIKASQQARVVVRIEMFVQLAFMALESLVLLIFHEYLVYLILRIVSCLVRNVLISKEIKNRFPAIDFNSKESLSIKDKSKLIKDISAMALYKISGVVLNGTDSVIISAFLGTSIVGIIGHFRMISNCISNLSNKIWVAVLPSVGNLATLNDSEKQYSVFNKMVLGSFIFASFCSIALFVLMNPFVTVWLGKEFTISTNTAFAMAFNMYLFLIILPFQTFRDANGLFVQGKYRPVIMSVINVCLSLYLVKPCGLFGVMIATPISRMVTQTWFDPYIVFKYVFHRPPFSYYKKFLIHFAITIMSGGIVCYLCNAVKIDNDFINLINGFLLCVVLPLLCYYILFHQEFLQLKSSFKRFAYNIVKKRKS